MFSSFPIGISAFAIASLGLLGGLLVAAAWHDVRSHRIPNVVVFSGAGIALALHALAPDGLGVASALCGLLVGLAAFLPLYLLGAAGAGDIKLMAMTGAFLGPVDGICAAIFTAVAGVLLAVACALRAGAVRRMAGNIRLIAFSLAARLFAVEGPSFD
ncbi:MAG TPA: prepilin peptidase, partial [Burkholderiales bacterium]|nr:prepilin peptidase [Burkholderiales bacterium]